MELVRNRDEVDQAARGYGAALQQSKWMQAQLAKNRRWYYVPAADTVVNALFLGYRDMTAEAYERFGSDANERLAPQQQLDKWFREVPADSPDAEFVLGNVLSLLRKYGRKPNRAASFYVPNDWPTQPRARGRTDAGEAGLRHTVSASLFRGDRQYVAECPTLGIVTQGETVDEALANLREAFELRVDGEDPRELGLAPGCVLTVQIEAARWAA